MLFCFSKNNLLPWLEALPVLTIFVPGLNEMSLQFYGVFEDLAVRAWKVPSPLQNQEDVALENVQRFVEAAVKSLLDQILSKKKNRVDLTTNQMLQFRYWISIFSSVLSKNWEGEIKQLEYFFVTLSLGGSRGIALTSLDLSSAGYLRRYMFDP